jgi:hypothetical protein
VISACRLFRSEYSRTQIKQRIGIKLPVAP